MGVEGQGHLSRPNELLDISSMAGSPLDRCIDAIQVLQQQAKTVKVCPK